MKNVLWFLTYFIFGGCSTNDAMQETSVSNGDINTIVPCENGMAGIYPCSGYDLLATISLEVMSAEAANDIWGWTDAETGNEYAIMGLDNGTAFIDISNSVNPIYLGKLPTATTSSSWRDVKVYGDYVYIVAEANNHGIQVFDLKKLRDVDNASQTFSADGNYRGFGNAHNIVINELSGFAYPVGTDRDDQFNGGVHFLNLQNPLIPTLVGGWGLNGYTHDAQVVTYKGPDANFVGAELFVGANEDQVVVVDISNKETPITLSTLPYPNIGYTHQGWFTEDHRYFILGDELDEVRQGFKTRTLIFDMADLENPVLHHTYLGPTNAIDHNGYVLGDAFFLANYTAGVRVLDITDIEGRVVVEKAFFDTYPANNNTQFAGVWSVYPYFESGKIIISDINSGFFVIRKSN
ncbi:choice-of-anchor B family protein [Maribacter sp. ACAM166]|uniref:choice-of-anchor B family protein n=1 Tax=Maribacter sp. ACAM166 TaxID=2508996 RepID=UPI0010FF607B|nr:choice-of-anchor B family protein [Maribacter sp. ACAM166]TLP77312.1 choice-of-anchor B family protein [Maribacter sp. ACAM166]